MTATTKCYAPILGKRIRVTSVSNCGVVPASATPNAWLATDGFISVKLTTQIENGAEILTKKADGSLCVNEKLADSFKRFDVEIDFCGVNPSLMGMVSNAKPYLDYMGRVAGFTVGEGVFNEFFALELWTGLAGASCVPGVQEASGYLLLPFVAAGSVGDMEINGDKSVDFSIKNSYTKGGNSWGVGPFNVLAGSFGTNEVQTVTITGAPTGGNFRLVFNGQQTALIPWNATAAQVQSALEALNNIAPGDITVTGGPGPATPYVVTFSSGGAWASEDVPQMTATNAFTGGVTPAIAVTTTTPGAGGPAGPLPTALDPFDHFLLVDTQVPPPPAACNPQPMP